jgi:hypothetical protein
MEERRWRGEVGRGDEARRKKKERLGREGRGGGGEDGVCKEG